MDQFYAFLGEKPSNRICMAVMNMREPFRNSANRNAQQAAFLFDRFQVLRHLQQDPPAPAYGCATRSTSDSKPSPAICRPSNYEMSKICPLVFAESQLNRHGNSASSH